MSMRRMSRNRLNKFGDSFKKSFTKYSNVELFERREKEFLTYVKPAKYSSTNKHKKIKQKILQKENAFYPILKTLTSFGAIDKSSLFENQNLQFISTTSTFNKNKTNPKFESIFNNYLQSEKNNKIFLTERNTSIGLYKKTRKKIDLANYKNNTEFQQKIDKKNSIRDLICKVEDQSHYQTSRDKKDYMLEYKLKRLNRNEKHDTKSYINKLREYQILNYTMNEKKERAIRIKETNISNIEYFEDTIKSLKSFKQIFTSKLYNKTADYFKFILMRKEIEKIKNSKLIQNILYLKSNIEQINTKIKKVELEKNNIIRWIYLQIKLKERKLTLPPYYKTIIEQKNSDTRIKEKRYDSQKMKKKLTRRFVSTFFKNDNEPISRKNSNVIKSSSSETFNFSKEKNIEEVERIKNYRNELIYKTPESFQDALLNLENQILIFIGQRDHIQNQLLGLKKQLIKVTNQEKEFKDEMDEKINEKQKEADELKMINTNKIKLLSKIREKPKIKLKDKKFKYNHNANTEKTNILSKIYRLYDICKSIEINGPNNLQNVNNNNNKIKKEDDILKILKYIEFSVDSLIKRVKDCVENKSNYEIQELIKKITSEIERRHKNDIAKKQKIQEVEKNNKLRNEIEERNNTINLLPRRKIDYYRFKIKKDKKNNIENNIKNEPQFEDYISENEEIDNIGKNKKCKVAYNNKDNSEGSEKSEEFNHKNKSDDY